MEPKLTAAIIGCGVVARKHMKAMIHNSDRVRLVALSDINTEAMDSLLNDAGSGIKERSSVRLFTDHRKLLESEHPDIAVITTPAGTHFTIGMDALGHGSNILIEKPMTLTSDEAVKLNNEASSRDLRIALGHIYRYFPLVEIIARDIRHEVFGRPLYGDVHVFWGHGQDYYDRSAWRGTWEQDGGVIMNQTIHAIDLMNYFLGGKSTQVSAMIARQTHKMEAEDLGMGIIRKDNGTFCTVTGTTSSDPLAPEASFDILLTNGRIRAGISSGRPYFNITSRTGEKSKVKNQNFYYIRRFISETINKYGFRWLLRAGAPHSWILRDLADSIINRTFPRADGLSGEESVSIVSALYHAAKEEKTMTLPLDSSMTGEIFRMKLDRI